MEIDGDNMGIILSHAKYIATMCKQNNITGTLVSLGWQDIFITLQECRDMSIAIGLDIPISEDRTNQLKKLINSNQHISSTPSMKKRGLISDIYYYNTLGFSTKDVIDIDPSQASIAFDLNQTGILAATKKQYDLVIDAGVMEHVFDTRNVLLNMTDLAKTNGYIIHIMISNNTMDHGFYQFSPTLFQDYYTANKYEIIDISILELRRDKTLPEALPFIDKWKDAKIIPYDSKVFGPTSFGQLSDEIYYTMVCVKKLPTSLRDVPPIQSPPKIDPWGSGGIC